jgi:hypothetical protein
LRVSLALLVEFCLGLPQGTQRGVPVCLERAGHQPVMRVTAQIALAGQVGFILSAFDLLGL